MIHQLVHQSIGLTELSRRIRSENATKGFFPTEYPSRYLLLVVSEICEAQDELRDGNHFTKVYDVSGKPCGFLVEIADAIIRLLHIGAAFEIDFDHDYPAPFKLRKNDVDGYLCKVVFTITRAAGNSGNKSRSDVFSRFIKQSVSSLIYLGNGFTKDYNNADNIFTIVERKLAYNRTRPHKHGRKF